MLSKTIALSLTALVTTAVSTCIAQIPKAQALTLNPGGTVSLSGTTFADRPELGGTVLRDTLRSIGQLVVQDRVVQENRSGTLDFYYTIRNLNSTGSAISLGQFVAHSSFANFLTDVDFRTDGLGNTAPLRASRSSDGSLVTFDFGDLSLLPDSQTNFFFIKTNATDFNELGQGTLNGTSFLTYQPATAVPTPALLPGLVGLGLAALRKRKSDQTEAEV